MRAAVAVQGLRAEVIDNGVSGALLLAEYKSDGLVRRRRRSLSAGCGAGCLRRSGG